MSGRAPPPLNALRTFEVFGRHRSMTRAAAELCVTHGAVSRQIAALQALMGVTLVTGPRHALTLTEAGAQLAERLTPAFVAIADAVEGVRQDAAREIEISCLGTFALKWLIPRLPDFLETHPEVRVRLSESYATVDYRRDRFDGAIRIVEPDQVHARTEATRFLAQYQGPVGAPAFSAVTQIGSPWSQKPVSLLAMEKTPSCASVNRLPTTPWWSGCSPVTSV